MEQLKIFQNPEFGTIRTIRDDKGEPLFCGKDVAVALGYGNSREALRKHVEQEDVTKRDTPTAGGTQQMQYVNESGLYALISGRRTCFTGYCFSLDMATALGQRPKGL